MIVSLVRSRWAVAASIVVLALSSAYASGDLVTRTFKIDYRNLEDIVSLIQPAISERGSYTVQPRIKTVSVTDTQEAIDAIESLIGSYDLPPRGVGLIIHLMRAEEGAETGSRPPGRQRRGIPPSVIQDVTKWGIITQLGSASVAAAEGEGGTVVLGEDYRVRFEIGTMSSDIGVVRMERFVLERLRQSSRGPEVEKTVMDLVLNLKSGRATVLGATSSQDSTKALFVSVTATAVDP
jgi:hypothetical protein